MSTFAPDGYFREPIGPHPAHRGTAELRSFFTRCFSAGGGIGLQHCAVTDDGVRCALEYNCVRWGSHDLPPQAGIGVYERGPDGLLAAARVYDDVEAPVRALLRRLEVIMVPGCVPGRCSGARARAVRLGTDNEPIPVPGPGEFVVAVLTCRLIPGCAAATSSTTT